MKTKGQAQGCNPRRSMEINPSGNDSQLAIIPLLVQWELGVF